MIKTIVKVKIEISWREILSSILLLKFLFGI